MRIGIDFGTSYSAAAAVVNGQVQLIRFGDDSQFRTTVYFPLNLPDLADFELTDAAQDEVRSLVASFKRDQNDERERVEALRRRAMDRPEPFRSHDLALLPTGRRRGDADLTRSAVAVVRRRWAADAMRQAMTERVDLQNALYGEEAVDAFVANGTGNLVVSPKSMLGFQLEAKARDVLLGIATQLLRHIRTTVSAQLRTEVRSAVMGRPVQFRSSMKEAGGVQALEILTDAATAAGFESVEFLEEPAAAAFGYHRRADRPLRTMILDIGGGTTDMALADIGGGTATPLIHRSWGEAVGGTDVDIELSMRGVMPLFGKGITRTGNHCFYEASAVQDLQRQARFRQTSFAQVDAPFGARLQRLQIPGHTVRLNRAVERAKIQLSQDDSVRLELDYIEPALTGLIDKERLTDAASPFMFQLRSLMQRARADLSDAPDTVYLTGGMSRSPYVPLAAREVFPESEIVMGDASLGVVTGLAHAAAA